MEAMGCDSMAIKDMAGLLTPYATFELVKALKAEQGLPVFIHSHDTAGLASMCQLKAIENGADSYRHRHLQLRLGHQPRRHRVDGRRAASGSEYDTGLDLELIQEIGLYFYNVRKKYHQFESEFTAVDTRVQVNQVPGGMMSNLANQLKEQGALNRINEVFAEIPQGARRPRLPAAGDPDLADRRHPGRVQRAGWRALQDHHQRGEIVSARRLRQAPRAPSTSSCAPRQSAARK